MLSLLIILIQKQTEKVTRKRKQCTAVALKDFCSISPLDTKRIRYPHAKIRGKTKIAVLAT